MNLANQTIGFKNTKPNKYNQSIPYIGPSIDEIQGLSIESVMTGTYNYLNSFLEIIDQIKSKLKGNDFEIHLSQEEYKIIMSFIQKGEQNRKIKYLNSELDNIINSLLNKSMNKRHKYGKLKLLKKSISNISNENQDEEKKSIVNTSNIKQILKNIEKQIAKLIDKCKKIIKLTGNNDALYQILDRNMSFIKFTKDKINYRLIIELNEMINLIGYIIHIKTG